MCCARAAEVAPNGAAWAPGASGRRGAGRGLPNGRRRCAHLFNGGLLLGGGWRARDLRRASDVRASSMGCLLDTSDAADEEDRVDLGGRRIIVTITIKKTK